MDPDITIRSYSVTGMSCAGCAKRILLALQNVPGLVSATVTLNPAQARLEMRGDLSAGQVNEALKSTGVYQLTEMEHLAPLEAPSAEEPLQSLYPLYLIVGYIAATVGLVAFGSSNGSRPSFS